MAIKVRQQNPVSSNGHAPTRYVAYCRVSSAAQAEKQTIETQLAVIRDYCEREQIKLVGTYRDEGVSGYSLPLDKRPEGKRLLDDAQAGEFNCILVYKFDRLGRNTRESLITAHTLESLGIAIRSVTEPFDTANPMGRFMVNQFLSFAELERNTICERSSAGIERNAKAGKWLGGYAPRGYKITADRKLIPDEDIVSNGQGMTEAELIQTLYRWIGDDRCSTLEVAKRLNEQRIPPAQTKRGHSHGVSGLWGSGTIAVMIHNPLYKGEHEFRRRYKKEGIQKYRYAVPALVTPELWQRAQDTITANFHHKRTTSHREYLLRGVVRCGLCGLGMTGASIRATVSGKPHFYYFYRCNTTLKQDIAWRHGQCKSRSVHAERLEQTVWTELAHWILDGSSLDEALAKALQDAQGEQGRLRQQLTKAHTKLENLEKERQRVISFCRQGVIDDKDLERQLAEVAQERQVLQQTIAAFEQRLSHDMDPHAALAHFHAHLARFREDIRKGTLSPTDKRRIIESLVTEVRVFGTVRKQNTRKPVIQQTIPWREISRSEKPQQKERTTVWQRNGAAAAPEHASEKIQITYRFPFAPTERALSLVNANEA